MDTWTASSSQGETTGEPHLLQVTASAIRRVGDHPRAFLSPH